MNDYDYEPPVSKGIFLRLKTKGEVMTIRIASSPYREPIIWKEGVKAPLSQEETGKLKPSQWAALMREPDYTISEQFHWVVIDRIDGQARIFSGGPMIYKSIKNYAQKEAWGDPKTYDLEVTRTEQPGKYYEVTALPDKSELTDEELQRVDAINISEKRPNAAPVGEQQIDDISEWLEGQSQTSAPPIEGVGSQGKKVGSSGYETAKNAAKKLKDKAEPDPEPPVDNPDPVFPVDDEPVNLDDIPF